MKNCLQCDRAARQEDFLLQNLVITNNKEEDCTAIYTCIEERGMKGIGGHLIFCHPASRRDDIFHIITLSNPNSLIRRELSPPLENFKMPRGGMMSKDRKP
jgi:hypothetical protein